jgi:hypothetical protein
MSNISLLPPLKLDQIPHQTANHPSIRPHNVTCEHKRQSFEQQQAPQIHKHAQSVRLSTAAKPPEIRENQAIREF